MFVERLICKCRPMTLPIRHLQPTRQLFIGQTRTARKKVQVEKELTLTTVEHFMTLFECNYYQAYKILNKHKTLRDINRDRLETAVQVCGKFGIEKREILENPDVLAIHPVTIENHSMVMQESGFTRIAAHSLVNYIPLLKKRISLLKAYGYIPTETNVPESLLSHLEPEMKREVAFPNAAKDSELNVATAGKTVLRHYLVWRLRSEPEKVDAVFKTYNQIKNKSFRLLRRTLDLLEFDIGFSKEKILKNGFLIHSNPNNTELILKQVEYLADLPIRTLLKKNPKIIVTSVDTILKTKKHLEEFGITAEAISKCPEIFTLGSDTVYERLSNLKVVPEFSVLLSHPRILRLVHFQRKAQSRLDYLHELRVKCVSLHILSAPEFLFEKYTRDGADKTKGTDISHFLGQELELSDQEIRSSLTRHPFWCHVSLVSVKETMDFLRQSGFTRDQIVASVQIVLYPKDRVARELASLSSHPELSDRQLFPLAPGWVYDKCSTPASSPPSPAPRYDVSSSDSDSDDDYDRVQAPPPSVARASVRTPPWNAKDYRLQLCLYFIEKEHHFTGNGIWTHAQSVEGYQSEVVSHSPLTQPSYKQRLA